MTRCAALRCAVLAQVAWAVKGAACSCWLPPPPPPFLLLTRAALYCSVLQELAGLWERLVAALTRGDQPAAADAALRFAYYW